MSAEHGPQPVVIEDCDVCHGRGVRPEPRTLYHTPGPPDHRCRGCNGLGVRLTTGLVTVQLANGGLLDSVPYDYLIHLVRHQDLTGSTPGRLLCGDDFRAQKHPDGTPRPGYSVAGGCSGPSLTLKPCEGCLEGATPFHGLPVVGLGNDQIVDRIGGLSIGHYVDVPIATQYQQVRDVQRAREREIARAARAR
jgi:hypothetical protein